MNRNETERKKKRDIVIATAYDLFVRKGLEKTSIRDIASLTGMNVNTIYYYFRTKAEIVICCVEYGLKSISKNLFSLASSNKIDDSFFADLLLHSLVNKEQFCWCYQVITSPNYNWLMKDILLKTRQEYDKYIVEIAHVNNIDTEELRSLAGLIILVVKDYMITEDENCIKQLRFLSGRFMKLVTKK